MADICQETLGDLGSTVCIEFHYVLSVDSSFSRILNDHAAKDIR
jgi:hypothetical protein